MHSCRRTDRFASQPRVAAAAGGPCPGDDARPLLFYYYFFSLLPQVQDPAEARPFLPQLMPLLDRLANEAADPELRQVARFSCLNT